MIDNAYTALAMGLLLIVMAFRSHHAACPTGWWVPEGMRTSGAFVCRPSPTGTTERTARGILVDHSQQPPGRVELHVYCPPNSIPTLIGPGTGLCAPR